MESFGQLAALCECKGMMKRGKRKEDHRCFKRVKSEIPVKLVLSFFNLVKRIRVGNILLRHWICFVFGFKEIVNSGRLNSHYKHLRLDKTNYE